MATSGSEPARWLLVRASAFSLPLRMWPSRTGTSKIPICTWPPRRSFTAGAAPFVGNVDQVDLRLGLEQLAGEVGDAAAARGAEIHLAGVCLRVGDELGQRVRRQRRVHGEHLGHAHHERDEREVLLHVVRDLGERIGRDHERRGAVDAQRVAVGRGFCRAVDAEHAADAGDVLHHHRLAQLARHALRERAAEDVRRAAGGEADDKPHRLAGVGLRPGASASSTPSRKTSRLMRGTCRAAADCPRAAPGAAPRSRTPRSGRRERHRRAPPSTLGCGQSLPQTTRSPNSATSLRAKGTASA